MQYLPSVGRLLRHATALLAFATLTSLFGTAAHAVPSYARQTGAECASCHVGGYGPQLTPYGVRFKLGGYTDTDGKDGKIPLSAMAVFNWARTEKDNPAPDSGLHANANDNGGMQEASVFLAGRLTDQIGTFIQSTYSGYERKWALDSMDIRWARTLALGEQEGVVGVSLNGNPTLTDPFNTIGQWRFPYTESDFGFGSGPSPLIEGLGGSVMGLNAYTLWDKNFYAELGAYGTLSPKGLSMINADDAGKFKNLGTYWRLAYFKDMKRDNFSVGLFGFNADLQPDRADGTANKYDDIGVDVAYQFLGNREHIYTLNASYIHEKQALNYSFNNGESSDKNNSLDQYKLAASYHYNQTWGVTGSLFNTSTSKDATLYGESSYHDNGNTSGYILQGDWTPWGKESSWGAPWANVRLGVQYTGYNKFNGGSHYLDDNGDDRKASDNNTLSFFVWTSI